MKTLEMRVAALERKMVVMKRLVTTIYNRYYRKCLRAGQRREGLDLMADRLRYIERLSKRRRKFDRRVGQLMGSVDRGFIVVRLQPRQYNKLRAWLSQNRRGKYFRPKIRRT